MKFAYLAILLTASISMILLDWRLKLAFFYDAKATLRSVVICSALLLLIDIIGVNWRIFSTNQAYVVGLGLGSENIPIEELVFLLFISYFVLCVYRFFVIRTNDA